MTFEEVLPALKAGKSIRRKGANCYFELYKDRCIRLLFIDENYNEGYESKTFTLSDILADDWEIADE